MRLVVLTDHNYLEAAFVTVHSLLKFCREADKITLLYLNEHSENDHKSHNLIMRFNACFNLLDPNFKTVDAVAFNSEYFSEFQRFHLTRATFQKLLLPYIFPDENLTLCIDAGMIFGSGLNDFLADVENRPESAITAFTVPSNTAVHESQLDMARHELYPGGGTLLFNNALYLKGNFLFRADDFFKANKTRLIYGEQDLICFVAGPNELKSFDEKYLRKHIDLASIDTWQQSGELHKLYLTQNYLYVKHVGVFKPWLRWVLNPNKSIYLDYIKSTEAIFHEIFTDEFLMAKHDRIDERHVHFARQELIRYEMFLSTSTYGSARKAF
jgi:lipopolysaccharide biosynthesis glycosyltransferase